MTKKTFSRAVHRLIYGLTGLVFLGVAATFLFAPLPSFAALGLMFGIVVLLGGILELLYAIFYRDSLPGWGWHAVAGALDVMIGLYLNAYPLASMTLIPLLAGFWLIWRGLTLCGYASQHRENAEEAAMRWSRWGEWTFGIGSVLWGVVMLWWPAEGALTVVYLLAIAFAWMGCGRIYWAFRK